MTRSNPCPVCGKDSWCSISADGQVVTCRRIESDRPQRDSRGDDYWTHFLTPNGTEPAAHIYPVFDIDPNPIPAAPISQRHTVYKHLLSVSALTDTHKTLLEARGFTAEQITRFQYRTLAHDTRDQTAAKIRAQFPLDPATGDDPLQGIPGLHHRNTDNRFTLGGWEGILIPVRTIDGRIQALKTRADDPSSDAKYRYVSSRTHGGASPGSPVHIPLHPYDMDLSVVRLTEGELKADLATVLTGTLTISVPGVSSWAAGIKAIEELGVQTVLLAFDADANEKPQVQRALRSTVNALLGDGYDVFVETWAAADGKGIDDLLAAGKHPTRTPGVQWLSIFGDRPDMPGALTEEPFTVGEPPVTHPAGRFALTDVGNAERLIATFGNDLRYHTAARQWLVWDDTRFKPAREEHEVRRRAMSTAKWVAWEANDCPDTTLARDTKKWSRSSQGGGRISAMMNLARSIAGVDVEPHHLDSDPYLFNVANGTIDLRTGTLRPHSQADLITKVSPVHYDPDAQLDMWDDFLVEAFGGDTEIIEFMQRLCGYALLGLTPEEIVVIIAGKGGTGKSTLLSALDAVFADYGYTAGFDTFLQRNGTGGPRNDIADLHSARLVWASEVERGKKLSAQVVKSLSGSDPVTCRYLYKENFTYIPKFLVMLTVNDLPLIEHDDDGMWRRVLQVKMDHVVPPSRRDPRLKETLRDPGRGGPAVLAWLVKGCIKYLQDGLRIPESVRATTSQYRATQDPLFGYLGTAVIEDPNAWSPMEDLYAAYRWWTDLNGEPPISYKSLSFKISNDRFPTQQQRWKGRSTRGRIGLRIAPDVVPELAQIKQTYASEFPNSDRVKAEATPEPPDALF